MSSMTHIYKEQYEKYQSELRDKQQFQSLTTLTQMYTGVVNTFSYKNLPKKVPFFFPEKWLYWNGMIATFKDGEEMKIFPAFPEGQLTNYGLFDRYTLIAPNGSTFQKGAEDVEICFNNTLYLPSTLVVAEMANNCDTALLAVKNTLRRACFSKIVETKDPSLRDKLQGILSGNYENDIAIVTLMDGLKTDKVSVHNLFDNKAEDVLSVWDVYVRFRNMFYTIFGVDTIEIQKKERLTEAEGSANSEISRYSLFHDMYLCRLDWVKRVDERFGVDYGLEVNRNSATIYNTIIDNNGKIENELIEITKGSNIQNVETTKNNNEDEEDVK